VASAIWGIAVLVFLIVVVVRARRRRSSRTFNVGPAGIGAVYDLLNQDRRNAVELIVEEKAEARDPEDADGNLPELERPKNA
jgi:hypothetical protein